MEGANQLWSEVFHTRGENYNTFLDVTSRMLSFPFDILCTRRQETTKEVTEVGSGV